MPRASLLGLRVTEAMPARVTAELEVRPELGTSGKIMHGRALSVLAETPGGISSHLTLPEGAKGTARVESKTNFTAAASEGETVTAECTPLSTGRRLSGSQNRIARADSRPVSLVT